MKHVLSILMICSLNNISYSSVFWVFPNIHKSDLEYNIVNKEVYIKKNDQWLLSYHNRIDKIFKDEKLFMLVSI